MGFLADDQGKYNSESAIPTANFYWQPDLLAVGTGALQPVET